MIVVLNPGDTPVQETLLVSNAKLMDGTRMVDLLGTLPGAPPTPRAPVAQ